MNLAASFNRKYVDYAIVLFTSFCLSNPEHNHLFILHSELTDKDIEEVRSALAALDVTITPIDVSETIAGMNLPVSSFWSPEIYYRLMLSDKLPEDVDRIMYLDVDVIVHGRLDDLYYGDFEGNDLMAADDSNCTSTIEDYKEKVRQMLLPRLGEKFRYFNSGVLMMNIAAMRGKNTFESYLDAMKEWDYQMAAPDQDILNYVHYDKVKFVPWEEYDLFAKHAFNRGWTYEDVKNKNKIIHFAGVKPWNFDGLRYDLERFWWEYAARTPIYHRLIEKYVEDSLTNTSLEDEAIRLSVQNREYAKAIDEARQLIERLS